MSIGIASKVAAYLVSLPNISNVVPVSITIKGTTYEGASYDSTLTYERSMQAVQSGKHKAGDPYVTHSIYLVGELPACYRRDKKICFQFKGDSRDWYIAAYMESVRIVKQNAEFHPFGATFLISPWDIPGSAIDDHEPRRYTRLPVERKAA